jgi:hypothetical protein
MTAPPTPANPNPPPWPQVAPSRPPSWPMFASLVIALVAIGLAIGCWFRPLPSTKASSTPPGPYYTNQQVGDAKATVCAVYEKVRRAVSVNTGRSGGDDPTAILAVASNARIALYNGGDYLSKKLLAQPATPPDLAKAVRTLVNAYQATAIDYLVNAPDPEQESSRDAVRRQMQQSTGPAID